MLRQSQDLIPMLDLENAESAESTEQPQEDAPRKLPKWAIAVAIIAFLIFNGLFLAYAMQMSGNPG
ncbi:MAG: hypothetical protein K2X27_06010 [Candidatus Obscuribacterales bacterium]|nr:hypothetical protein [Candidatus Obscuribacterales bacterium]